MTGPDRVLVGELEDMGFAVTVRDDDAAVTATGATAVVVLSTSAQVAGLGTRYKAVSAPLVALGNNAWPDTGLTQGPNGLNYDTQNLVVLDSTHPVAAGLPTTFAPAETAGNLQSVNEPFLPAGADPVAARAGELARHVVYTVPAGETLGDGSTAASRRVVLGFSADTVTDLSAEGYQLLDNAVQWAAEGSPGATRAVEATAGATLAVKGRWVLDRIKSNNTTPSALVGQQDDAGDLDVDTSVGTAGRVATVGAGSLFFPGWDDGDGNPDTVHKTRSSVRIPERNYFDMQTQEQFQVVAWIRPEDVSTSPVDPGQTTNIVQKGLTTDLGGQWKMSLREDMRPGCEFKGDTNPGPGSDITTLREFLGEADRQLVASDRYKVTCLFDNGRVNVDVDEVIIEGGGVERVGPYESQNDPCDETTCVADTYFQMNNDDKVWVGKKPNDATANDTYAGRIDNLVISRTS